MAKTNAKKHSDRPEMKGVELPTPKNAPPPAQDYFEDKGITFTTEKTIGVSQADPATPGPDIMPSARAAAKKHHRELPNPDAFQRKESEMRRGGKGSQT